MLLHGASWCSSTSAEQSGSFLPVHGAGGSAAEQLPCPSLAGLSITLTQPGRGGEETVVMATASYLRADAPQTGLSPWGCGGIPLLSLVSAEVCGALHLGHVATEPALPRSAPQAAREISHVTVAAVLTAGEVSPRQHGIQPQSPCQHPPRGRKGHPATCWVQQGAPPWQLTDRPEPPFSGLACGGLALSLLRAGCLLGLPCPSRLCAGLGLTPGFPE